MVKPCSAVGLAAVNASSPSSWWASAIAASWRNGLATENTRPAYMTAARWTGSCRGQASTAFQAHGSCSSSRRQHAQYGGFLSLGQPFHLRSLSSIGQERQLFASGWSADALNRRLGAALAQYATTRRACDQIRSMAPPGSALAFAAMARMSRLPENGGAGLPPAVLSKFSDEFRRLARASAAAQDFNSAALELVDPHLRDARDCRAVIALVGMIQGGPRLTLYMRAAERLSELGEAA